MSYLLKDAMMFTKRSLALRALGKISGQRNFTEGDEAVCPAEVWVLEFLEAFESWGKTHPNFRKGNPGYQQIRKLIGIARSLGHYPIPAWWKVSGRMSGKKIDTEVEMFLDKNNHPAFHAVDKSEYWTSNRPPATRPTMPGESILE